ncbi:MULTISPECIES: DUF2953 domain-containing protein [Paenibacillus]|uniref:DUF2953 domain-containing protein n=1 Tax=Paenibacillus albilobatus TaxID=2716884 RepID=A0A920CAE9_9BACL|nr:MULTISPECIES: DUF2953 domain-containing protein [Paenibacillus]GIO30823.1 hypothetical protein J2TS6_19640 [Paenibacillus albilobatus]
MWIALVVIAVIVIMIIAAAMSNITCTVRYKKEGSDDRAEVDIRMLFGFVRFHYEMPKLKFENMKKGFLLKLEKQNSISRKSGGAMHARINKRKIELWSQDVRILLKSTVSLKKWLQHTFAHVRVHDLNWSTRISAGEAEWTAVATGVLWSIKTTLVGWLSYQVRMKKNPHLNVIPEFTDEMSFSTEFFCVSRLSFGYAMYASFVLMSRILQVEGGVKKWFRLYRQMKAKSQKVPSV